MFKKFLLLFLLVFSSQLFAQINEDEDTNGISLPKGVNLPTSNPFPTNKKPTKLPDLNQNIPGRSPMAISKSDSLRLQNPTEIKEGSLEDTYNQRLDSSRVYLPPLGIFGHDYLRRSDFQLYDKSNKVKIDDSYILGVGDNLTVSIWNNDQVKNFNFTISDDGFVELGSIVNPVTGEAMEKGIGRIYLSGLTFGKAKEILRSKYRGGFIFNNEDFDVSLTAVKNINIDIIGQVELPGPYKIPAINTVYNVIKLSGGPTASGTVRDIQVRRNGQIIQHLDVYNYLLNGDNRENIYLQEGDVIFVPPIKKLVELSGAIVRPKKFELKENEDFGDLIKFAGGFLPNAQTQDLELYRYFNDEYILKNISFKKNNLNSYPEELLNGDFIFIDDIPNILRDDNLVFVSGAVNEPDRYEFIEGMRISDLIGKAKGLRFDAVLTKAYLTRLNDKLQPVNISVNLSEIIENPNSEENILLYPMDKINILSKSKFAEKYVIEVFGEVKKQGVYNFGTSLTLQDVLIMSGGFKTEALTNEVEIRRVIEYNQKEKRLMPIKDKIIKLNVDYNYLNPENTDNQFQIMPMDQVFVRAIPEFEKPKVVFITGEVKYPGYYPIIDKGMRVSDLIRDAGGLTPYSYKPGAKFYRNAPEIQVVKDTTMVNGIMEVNDINKEVIRKKLHVLDLVEVMQRENSKYNYVLKPGDAIKVPAVDETISIAGAIKSRNAENADINVVHTAFRGRKNAKWYINEFGAGFDKKADKQSVQVIYPNGQTKGTQKFLFFKIYPEVQPGSDILIEYELPKEKNGKFGEFFKGLNAEKTIALIGTLASTIALVKVASK